MLNVYNEFIAVLWESADYLRSEIDYCLLYYADTRIPSEKSFVSRAEILSCELDGIEQIIKRHPSSVLSPIELWKLGLAQFRLMAIPKALFEISQAISNRRGPTGRMKGIYTYSPPMRSIHPYYSTSYCSIECFSYYYHQVVKTFFLPKYCPGCPVVDTWTSDEYAWDPTLQSADYIETPTLKWIEDSETELDPFYKLMRNGLDMTTLNVPRWASHQLRKVGGLLPHELFHRVMSVLSQFVVRDASSFADKDYPQSYYHDAFKAIYGEYITILNVQFANLMGDLMRYVYVRLGPIPEIESQYEPVLSNVAEEIFCDAFGYYLCGEPFIYALGTEVFPLMLQSYAPAPDVFHSIESDDPVVEAMLREFYLDMDHPHPIIRLIIVVRMAEIFGCRDSIKSIKGYLRPLNRIIHWRGFRPRPSPSILRVFDCNDFLKHFTEYVYSNKFKAKLTLYFNLLEKIGIKNFSHQFGCNALPKDERWNIRRPLREGLTKDGPWDFNILFNDKFSPVDLLSTIWDIKGSQAGGVVAALNSTGNQTAWRIFLENYLATRGTDEKTATECSNDQVSAVRV